MWLNRLLPVVVVVGAWVTPRPATAQPETVVRVERNVEYGRAGGESLRLDLYAPAGEATGLRPGVLFLHGGGWTGGDKREFAARAREMASRGYVAASVNYRLAPKHRYPAAVEDARQAVRWLCERAEELRLDTTRIGVVGASAGAHLAAMLGVQGARDPFSRVRCVVSYFGRMDMTLEQAGPGFTDNRPAFLGRTKAEAPELYVEASPITHVSAQSAPFLLIHGTQDTQVPPIHSERMLSALEKAGVEASLLLLANQGHGFRGAGLRQAWDAAKTFLDRHLKPGTTANARR